MLKQIGIALVAAAMAAPAVTAVPVLAQGEVTQSVPLPEVTQDQVLAACAAEGATESNCKLVLAQYFGYLAQQGIAGTELEALIATLVDALATSDAAKGALKAVVVAAIKDIGTNYAAGDQAEIILGIADSVDAGEEIQTSALGLSGA